MTTYTQAEPSCVVQSCVRPIHARLHCRYHHMSLVLTGRVDAPRVRVSKDATLDERLRFIGWSEGDGDCWNWAGKVNRSGYGVMNTGQGRTTAHRAAFQAWRGGIPESVPGQDSRGPVVMHLCDNRQCVNPAHLAIGSQAENMRDMANKGRGRRSPVTIESPGVEK